MNRAFFNEDFLYDGEFE